MAYLLAKLYRSRFRAEERLLILSISVEAKYFMVLLGQKERRGPLTADTLPEARENLQQDSMKTS